MKLGEQISLSRIRRMCTEVKVPEFDEKLREFVSEYIVSIKLHELGMKCELRQKCPHCGSWNMPRNTDMLAFRPFVKEPVKVRVQVKPEISTARIDIDKRPLADFKGWYVVLVERRKEEDAFLYIESDEMRKLFKDNSYRLDYGKKRPHTTRRCLPIPRSLEGYERYLDPSSFVKAVLEDPYTSSQEEG